MPEIYEVVQSQSGKDGTGRNSKRKLLYHVLGTDDDATIMATVLATSPPSFVTPGGTLNLDDVSKTQIGPEFWAAEVNYIDPEKQEDKKKRPTGTLVASWDTTGGTQHITTSLETVDKAGDSASDPPPDFRNAIEVTESGVNGTDVVVPLLRLELEYKFPNASVTDEYIRQLRDLTGTTNHEEFKGWAAGELLFMGSNGRQSSDGDISARFIFAAGKNIDIDCEKYRLVEETTGEWATLTKGAHDHLWFYFKKAKDAAAAKVVHRPIAAYVERVYEKENFALIGIGT